MRSSPSIIRLVSFILIRSLLNRTAFAYNIFRPLPGGGLRQSFREPKYKIDFHPEDSPFYPDDDLEAIILPNKEGMKFLCFLPKVTKSKDLTPAVQHNSSSMHMETENNLNLKTPDELLDGLNNICLLRQEGWWTYEFCFKKALRQFHMEDGKLLEEYVLGVFDAEATANFSDLEIPTYTEAHQRYHTHIYTNGTTCDLTKKPRETEVRFVCSEQLAMISSVTELSTCKYAVTVQIPTLCKHPLFDEERQVWQTVNCNALPNDQRNSENSGQKSREDDDSGGHQQDETTDLDSSNARSSFTSSFHHSISSEQQGRLQMIQYIIVQVVSC